MTITSHPKPENPYAEAYKGFREQTENHHLVVLHDDGLYKHLRVQAPGTRMWSWDVTAWPGHLATSGDIADGYMFSREADMLAFFSSAGNSDDGYYSDGAPSIDVRYWAEKLCGGRSHEVKVFSEDAFLRSVREHLDEHKELGVEAREDRARKIVLIKQIHQLRKLDNASSTELFDAYIRAQKQADLITNQRANTEARNALSALWSTEGLSDEELDDLIENHRFHEFGDESFSVEDPLERVEEILDEARTYGHSTESAHTWLQNQEDLFGSDTWEWDLREYDIHFLFTCYAIHLTTRLWREHVQRHGVNDTYVLVRDGRVDNRPSQPVIDLSFLEYGVPDESAASEAVATRAQIMAVPQAREELPVSIRELTELVLEHGNPTARAQLDRALEQEARVRERAADRSEQQEQSRLAREEREAARRAGS